MKPRRYFIYALPVVLCLCQNVRAQRSPFKMGDIPNDLLKMASYAKDPDADAVVMYDFGVADLRLENNGNKVVLERQCRIKVFNDDGFGYATTVIPIYHDNDIHESVSQIKGYTYNLVDGSVEKTKLDKASIFEEETSENWEQVKFTMPNVKEGSVIEFSYTVNSESIGSMPKWQFQKDIPVAWSEYYVKIPEYFNYIQLTSGYEPFAKYETSSEPRHLGAGTGSVNFQANIYHYIAKDMPALRAEAFVPNPSNYRQAVEFQLSNYNIPGVMYKEVMGTWESITKRLVDDSENFGPNMNKKGFYKDELRAILAKYQTPDDRLAAIFSFVAGRVKWDKLKDYIPNQSIKKTFDDRVGSSADINALLISMLRAADIDADPVLISTQDHGLVNPAYPILSKFNYLIAVAYIGDKKILLDATEDLPVGYLPTRCLNQQGRVISEVRPGWIELEPEKGADIFTMCQMDIGLDGTLTGKMQRKLSGYAALEVRKKIEEEGKDKYLEAMRNAHKSWHIKAYNRKEAESGYDPVQESFDLTVDNAADVMGDIIYINPILADRMAENPFKQEERKLPIDYIYPYRKYYMLNLNIPEGFVVDELPGPIQMSTPDGSATFKFLVNNSRKYVQLVSSMSLKRSLYPATEYKILRQFYATVVSKHNAQIVLKKKTEASHEASNN